MNKIKTYKMGVSEEDEDGFSGVYCISVVDDPAIGVNYLKFSKENKPNLKFQVVNEDKRILTGAIMLADTPIYRNFEPYGEHYVTFDRDTIEKIAQKFFRYGFQGSSNVNHDEDLKLENVYFYESFIIDREKGKNPPKGFENIPDGSWFGTMKVEDAGLWEVLKSDDFKGFSIEGYFLYNEPVRDKMKADRELTKREKRRLINQLKDVINS